MTLYPPLLLIVFIQGHITGASYWTNYTLCSVFQKWWNDCRNYNSTWGGNADIESVALYNLADDPMEKLNLAKNDTMAEKVTKKERSGKKCFFKLFSKVEELRSRLDHHVSRAVLPMHREPSNDGNRENPPTFEILRFPSSRSSNLQLPHPRPVLHLLVPGGKKPEKCKEVKSLFCSKTKSSRYHL